MTYYRFLLNLVGVVLRVFWNPEYLGREHIPSKGAVIVCSNHVNAMDPFLVAFGFQREISYLAKEELFRHAMFRHFLIRTGMIPVKRGQSDRQAIRTVIQRLEEQRMIGIFPEGTRSNNDELLDFHDGAVYFALKTGATLLPAAIVGDYKKGKRMRVVYGQGIPVAKSERTDRDQMHQITLQLAEEIKRLKGVPHGD